MQGKRLEKIKTKKFTINFTHEMSIITNFTHRTSFSISNSDKQIAHFSASSSVSLGRLTRLYLCGKVFLSIISCNGNDNFFQKKKSLKANKI